MEQFRFRYSGLELKSSGLLDINVSDLKLGGSLFFGVSNQPPENLEVKSGYDHSFSHVSRKFFEDSIKLRISWIAWKSKVVILIRRYETNDKKLYEQLKGICSFEEFKDKIEKLKELPEGWTPSTRDVRNHPISFIESLVSRLEVVKELESKELFWFPRMSVSALALFIVCTCIESLGSKHPFLSYNEWITSKKNEKEVNAVIKKASCEKMSKALLVRVFEEYVKRYGTNNAYRAFFDSLDDEWKSSLEETFTFLRNEPPNFEAKESKPLPKLRKFLLRFRHAFAHKLEIYFSVPTEMEWKTFQEKFKTPNREVYSGLQFFTAQKVFSSGAFETISTRNFLGTLTQTVRVSLWQWICKHSKNQAKRT